jgi:prevent-host-death family protein
MNQLSLVLLVVLGDAMKTLNIHEAKTRLSAVLAEVSEKGEKYIICRNGKPVADLVPHVNKSRLVPHPVLRKIRIKYDPREPLTPEEWPQEVL